MNNQMPVFMRRQHGRNMGGGGGGGGGIGSAYPSTATSGLLSNQYEQRIIPRSASSMWHPNYNDSSWRGNPDGNPNNGIEPIRRIGGNTPRIWLHHRNPVARAHERRTPYNNPWPAPEVMYVENPRQIAVTVHHAPVRGPSLFGGPASRNVDRIQPYGASWRSSDMFYENPRPAHRPVQSIYNKINISSLFLHFFFF